MSGLPTFLGPVRETHGPHRKPPVETCATESNRVKAMHGIKTSQTRLPELAAAGHLRPVRRPPLKPHRHSPNPAALGDLERVGLETHCALLDPAVVWPLIFVSVTCDWRYRGRGRPSPLLAAGGLPL